MSGNLAGVRVGWWAGLEDMKQEKWVGVGCKKHAGQIELWLYILGMGNHLKVLEGK